MRRGKASFLNMRFGGTEHLNCTEHKNLKRSPSFIFQLICSTRDKCLFHLSCSLYKFIKHCFHNTFLPKSTLMFSLKFKPYMITLKMYRFNNSKCYTLTSLVVSTHIL